MHTMSILIEILTGILAGGLAGYLSVAALSRRLRSLELDQISFETKFLREQKSRAARERWDPKNDQAMLEGLAKAAEHPPKRNPLLKFGIGK